MSHLLLKDILFERAPECDIELAYLKNCLVTDPILQPVDPYRDIVRSTDASIYRVGFCVMQTDYYDVLHTVR